MPEPLPPTPSSRDALRPDPPSPQSPFKGKRGLRRILAAFFNSLDGLAAAYRTESAFRQEVWLSLVLAPVALLLPFDGVERLLLLGSLLLLLAIELVNSSLEATIDRISLANHHLSKRAKDMGSAAVLCALVIVAMTWLTIAGPVIVALLPPR